MWYEKYRVRKFSEHYISERRELIAATLRDTNWKYDPKTGKATNTDGLTRSCKNPENLNLIEFEGKYREETYLISSIIILIGPFLASYPMKPLSLLEYITFI